MLGPCGVAQEGTDGWTMVEQQQTARLPVKGRSGQIAGIDVRHGTGLSVANNVARKYLEYT